MVIHHRHLEVVNQIILTILTNNLDLPMILNLDIHELNHFFFGRGESVFLNIQDEMVEFTSENM